MTNALRHFTEGALYSGSIVSQHIYFDANEVPSLVLDIKLTGQLLDQRRPDGDKLECPAVNVEVRMTFDPKPEAEERLGYSMKDLQSIGFTGVDGQVRDDLESLSPAAAKKDFFDLAGKEVFVTPKYKVYNDKESIWWNLRFPQNRVAREAKKGELGKSKAATAWKELRAKRKKEADDKLAEAASNTAEAIF